MEAALVVVVVALALGFGFTNGFNDAANAIATSVTTRALTPRAAIGLAATMNLVGAMLGTGVALTISTDLVEVSDGIDGLLLVLSALLAAIVWNVVMWWRAIPASSSHALIGALAGAGIASAATLQWTTITQLVLLPLVLAPLLGFAVAFAGMLATMWLTRTATPSTLRSRFRVAQTVSAAAMALGHGLQDAQKIMGAVVLALLAGGVVTTTDIPWWVALAAAAAMAAGTSMGGWRIVATLGRRVVAVDPPRGFVAETTAAGLLYVGALLQAPISSTHTITGAILGAGSTGGWAGIRWRTVRRIAIAWVVTPLATAACAWLLHGVLDATLGSD